MKLKRGNETLTASKSIQAGAQKSLLENENENEDENEERKQLKMSLTGQNKRRDSAECINFVNS